MHPVSIQTSLHIRIYSVNLTSSTTLAPPGVKIVLHIKSHAKTSWDLNGAVGYYVGPALQYYRCITCYFPKTKNERVCDTIHFIPHVISIPQVSVSDHLRQATTDIVELLKKTPSTTYPALAAGDHVRNALHELATLLGRVTPID